MKSLLWDIDILDGLKQSGAYEKYVKYEICRFLNVAEEIASYNTEFVLDYSETGDGVDIFFVGTDFHQLFFRLPYTLDPDEKLFLRRENAIICNLEYFLEVATVLLSEVFGINDLEIVLSSSFKETIMLLRKRKAERFEKNQNLDFDSFDEWDWMSTRCECCSGNVMYVYETVEGKHALCLTCAKSIESDLGIHAWDLVGNHKCVITGRHDCINYRFESKAGLRDYVFDKEFCRRFMKDSLYMDGDSTYRHCPTCFTLTPRILKSILTTNGKDLSEKEYQAFFEIYG